MVYTGRYGGIAVGSGDQRCDGELRLLLGLLVQLLSQQREFIRQSVSTRLFLQGFDMQPLFRSGNFFQAVLLPSYISNVSVRPLCSTGVTPLPRSYGPLRLPARATPWLCIPSGR